MKKLKEMNRFWFIFSIVSMVLVLLMIVIFICVWNSMKKYEKHQSYKTLDKYVETLAKEENCSKDDISYSFVTSSTDTETYKFVVDKGTEKKNYTVVIRAKKTRSLMKFLSISDWVVDTVEVAKDEGNSEKPDNLPEESKPAKPDTQKDEYNATITVPSSYKVYVDDTQLTSEFVTLEFAAIEAADFVNQYQIPVPTCMTYSIGGMTKDKVVKITDAFDNVIDTSAYEDFSDVKIPYPEAEMPQELKDHVYAAAIAYSNFFSRDLPGCTESTAGLAPYFPEGSDYIAYAEQYRQEDMWMFSSHDAPVFENTQVIEYTPYSEQCFTVRIIFDKSMYLNKANETRVEHNDQIYTYVNINGSWVIVDIRTASQNE